MAACYWGLITFGRSLRKGEISGPVVTTIFQLFLHAHAQLCVFIDITAGHDNTARRVLIAG